jgi:hypothetical protein
VRAQKKPQQRSLQPTSELEDVWEAVPLAVPDTEPDCVCKGRTGGCIDGAEKLDACLRSRISTGVQALGHPLWML